MQFQVKQEELKTWKKIEETKKKAYEIYILKKKNEERQKEVNFDVLSNNYLEAGNH